MFSKLLGSIIIISVLYIMFVFIAPAIADQYWNKEINTKIREYKNKSLEFASGSDSPSSLFEKIKSTSNTYIDATATELKKIEQTVNTKVNQVKDAWSAIETAYSGVIDAKNKIQILTGTWK